MNSEKLSVEVQIHRQNEQFFGRITFSKKCEFPGYFPGTERPTQLPSPPLTLDKVLDFGFLGPETKVGGGGAGVEHPPSPSTLVSSFNPPLLWDTPLNIGQNFYPIWSMLVSHLAKTCISFSPTMKMIYTPPLQ